MDVVHVLCLCKRWTYDFRCHWLSSAQVHFMWNAATSLHLVNQLWYVSTVTTIFSLFLYAIQWRSIQIRFFLTHEYATNCAINCIRIFLFLFLFNKCIFTINNYLYSLNFSHSSELISSQKQLHVEHEMCITFDSCVVFVTVNSSNLCKIHNHELNRMIYCSAVTIHIPSDIVLIKYSVHQYFNQSILDYSFQYRFWIKFKFDFTIFFLNF